MTKKEEPITKLSGAQARFLRGLGHHLEPVVMVGKEGMSDALIAATTAALARHELIKLKILSEAPVDRHELSEELSTATKSLVAQVLGRTVLLYRKHPKNPKIKLPLPAPEKGKSKKK